MLHSFGTLFSDGSPNTDALTSDSGGPDDVRYIFNGLISESVLPSQSSGSMWMVSWRTINKHRMQCIRNRSHRLHWAALFERILEIFDVNFGFGISAPLVARFNAFQTSAKCNMLARHANIVVFLATVACKNRSHALVCLTWATILTAHSRIIYFNFVVEMKNSLVAMQADCIELAPQHVLMSQCTCSAHC